MLWVHPHISSVCRPWRLSVQCLSHLDMRCWERRGVKLGVKVQGAPSRPGTTGEGKATRGEQPCGTCNVRVTVPLLEYAPVSIVGSQVASEPPARSSSTN